MEIILYNDYCSSPPNTFHQILQHPSGNLQRSIEIAIFNEHRFAFYYWLKWRKLERLCNIPDLITFDWHQDLRYPSEETQEELNDLDMNNLGEVSYFAWARLNPLNDNHILAAAYLNQIANIWVVCKQSNINNLEDEALLDINGLVHKIRKFGNYQDLFTALIIEKINDVFFDIDLDYFTNININSIGKQVISCMTKKSINDIFDIENEFTKWLLKRICGFTVALEPKYTGGLSQSVGFLKVINSIFFDKSLFDSNCTWKHLKNQNKY